jgi:hypothetical protein
VDDATRNDVSVVREFIARINASDVEGLGRLMTTDHSLEVFDEAPLAGRDANIEAWHGYAASWPRYCIYEDSIGGRGEWIAVLGHTTGSHLELPDEEEAKLTLIWVADVVDGLVHTWRLEPDTIERRAWYGIPG